MNATLGHSLRTELEKTQPENRVLRHLVIEVTLTLMGIDPYEGMGRVTTQQFPRDRQITTETLADWLSAEYRTPV